MILITGGAGYIGSHTAVFLLKAGYDVLIYDNFSNSSPDVLQMIGQIAGREVLSVKGDMRDRETLDAVFSDYKIDAALHFAGLKAVGESVMHPLAYYENNVTGTHNLLCLMQKHGVKKLIFSSSATVYKQDNPMPLTETAELGCTNPYGWSKFMCERMIADLAAADGEFSAALLRYFNPIGAHESGLIGERPSGVPNNLLPYVSGVAAGRLKELKVYGGDYDTEDGTGVRDYIHVCDLAEGHIRALEYVNAHSGAEAFNLGTGQGYSVLQVVAAFEKASGRSIPYVMEKRRPGDIALSCANCEKAKRELHWEAKYGLLQMCRDAWRFERRSQGFEKI